jgi:hypothetical protein
MSKLFAIQDNTGMYVDGNTIHHFKENGKWEWEYRCRPNYKNHINIFSLFGKAEGVIKNLEQNLHKVSKDFVRTFSIVEVV